MAALQAKLDAAHERIEELTDEAACLGEESQKTSYGIRIVWYFLVWLIIVLYILVWYSIESYSIV